MLSVKGLVEN